MKRYIKSSYGDIQLNKFVFVPSEPITGLGKDKYNSNLGGYLYFWTYTYNKLTHETDDRMLSHSDVIDSLPSELRRKDRIWGRVDYYPSRDQKSLFIGGDIEPTSSQRRYLEKMCNV